MSQEQRLASVWLRRPRSSTLVPRSSWAAQIFKRAKLLRRQSTASQASSQPSHVAPSTLAAGNPSVSFAPRCSTSSIERGSD